MPWGFRMRCVGRRFRFSLRTLFVLMSIATVLCGVAPAASRRYRKWKQDGEIAELIRLIQTTIVSSGSWDEPPGRDDCDAKEPAAP